ncbi:MAG: DUF2490 domain-containing protein [Bacteroidia bacterium]
MNLLRFFLFLFIFILPCKQLLAQADYIDDAALWIGFNLEKKINDKIYLHLSQQNRITENISTYGRGNIDVGVTYRFTKNIRLMGDYVYLKRPNPDNSFTNEHRLYAALILKKEIGRWDFAYRNMLQMRMKNIYSSEDGKVPQYYERNKLTVKYELNKFIRPYISGELFYPFYQGKSKGLNKVRTAAGLDYKITKHTSAEFYFLYQQQLNAFNTTNRDFVYGLGLSHEL